MSFDASTAVLVEDEPSTGFDPASAMLVEDEPVQAEPSAGFDPSTAMLVEDEPTPEEPPPSPVPTPFEERPVGMVALDPLPQAKPSPLPSPAEEQTASLSRDALADANARRGIFSPSPRPTA